MFAQPAQHTGHGHGAFQQLAGAGLVAGGHFGHETADIHVERAGRLALGPFLLDAVAFDGVELLLYVHTSPSRSKATGRADDPPAPSLFYWRMLNP